MQIFTSSPLLRHLLTPPWQSAHRRSRDGEWFVWSRMKSSKPKHAFGKVANLLAFTEKGMRFLGGRNVLVPACPIASCSWQGWQGGGMVTVPVALRGPPNSCGPCQPTFHSRSTAAQQRGCSTGKKPLEAVSEGNAPQCHGRSHGRAARPCINPSHRLTATPGPQSSPRGGNYPLNSHISLTASEV